jgi:hypothetical protein
MAVVVASVDSIAAIPGAGVERTIGAKRDVALGKNVRAKTV